MILLLLACTYTVEDYWADLSEAHCTCTQDGDVPTCMEEWEARYSSTDAWAQCRDEDSPITRSEARQWVNDYTDACRLPDSPVLYPDDPDWSQQCSP
ncbi:MAG: hypothetical protein VX899_03815 [Myxococcota bacterium]|nr:hypothetical protein [Myxococcota bacterium]